MVGSSIKRKRGKGAYRRAVHAAAAPATAEWLPANATGFVDMDSDHFYVSGSTYTATEVLGVDPGNNGYYEATGPLKTLLQSPHVIALSYSRLEAASLLGYYIDAEGSDGLDVYDVGDQFNLFDYNGFVDHFIGTSVEGANRIAFRFDPPTNCALSGNGSEPVVVARALVLNTMRFAFSGGGLALESLTVYPVDADLPALSAL